MDYFAENTPSDFYVKLPYLLKMGSDWSVGVNQIWMPKMWYNVDQMDILVADDKVIHEVSLPNGFYETTDQLISELNKCLTINDVSYAEFSYMDFKHKIRVSVKDGYNLALPYQLSNLLGAEREHFKGVVLLEKCPDLHKFDNNISIHLDIVEGILSKSGVDNNVKLLNTSDLSFGSVIYDGVLTSFSKVTCETFDTIHVSAKNSLGEVIKQEGGLCLIELHFKRY